MHRRRDNNSSKQHPTTALAHARIINNQGGGFILSNAQQPSIFIFLSGNGKINLETTTRTTSMNAVLGTTIFIGGEQTAQIIEWDASNKILEIAIESSYFFDIIGSIKSCTDAPPDLVGVYPPEAGFGILASRMARKIGPVRSATGMYRCAPTVRFLIAMMIDIKKNCSHLQERKEHRLPQRAVSDVSNYIEQKIASAIFVKDMAKLATLSRFHFARTFKASTGRSPHTFILDSRLRRAEYLLSETRHSLSQIADESGFSSQSHLTTAFKKRIGITPGQYRGSHSNSIEMLGQKRT